MKYIEEEHEKYKNKKGNYSINGKTYYLKVCKNCNNLCLTGDKDGLFCDKKCSNHKEHHPMWGRKHKEETKLKWHLDRSGRTLSNEHKQNISIALTGKIRPRWIIEKLIEVNKGKTLSLERKLELSIMFTGENNPNWRGGACELNVAIYRTYGPRLEKYEVIRENEKGFLETKCTYCDKWYQPKIKEVAHRIESINGKNRGENRFYCSEECKHNCNIYNQKKYPKGFKIATSREVQPELRKMRFELDDWICQLCNNSKNLHCHHYEGIEQNPIESADIDMCITVCKKCHAWIHKQIGCTYYDLRKKGQC